jgi:hypothetical protein
MPAQDDDTKLLEQGNPEGNNAWFFTILDETTPKITVSAYPAPSGVLLEESGAKATVKPIEPADTARVVFRNYAFRLTNDQMLRVVSGNPEVVVAAHYIPPANPNPTSTGDMSSTSTVWTPTLPPTANSMPTSQSVFSSAFSDATPRPTSNPIRAKDNKGIASGAVAGVAIGCLVAGALFSGLILWFCLGRSKKSARARDQESSSLALMPPSEKGPVSKILSVGSGSPGSGEIDGRLPQPLEDEVISSGISGIGVSIKNHVQSFYHSGRVSSGLLDLDDLQSLGSDLPISTGTLSTLLGNPDTREVAIRFCIGWVVVSRMQLSSPGTTFLPPEVAECFRSMAIVNCASQCKYYSKSAERIHINIHVAQMSFLAKWRGITAELLQPTYVRNPFSTSDPRQQSIEIALDTLDGILLPFADSRMDNTQRIQNLREILKRAATFAFTLFSQPSTWDFDWQEQQGVLSGGLCIFPAFVQVTDESGESVKPPRILSEAIVRSLD